MKDFVLNLLMLLCVAESLTAASIYRVEVNTSILSSSTGGVILQFSPGFDSADAAVRFQNLDLGGGALVTSGSPFSPDQSAGVTGVFSTNNATNTLRLTNANGGDYHFSTLTYGNNFAVDVMFDLPTPLTGNSGGSFVLGFFSDAAGTVPALTPDPLDASEYRQVQIDYDEFGSFSVGLARNGAKVSLVPDPGNGGGSEIPEPGSYLLCLGGIACFLLKRR